MDAGETTFKMDEGETIVIESFRSRMSGNLSMSMKSTNNKLISEDFFKKELITFSRNFGLQTLK